MADEIAAMAQGIFGGDTASSSLSWSQIAARAAFVYFLGLLIIRIGKSRLLSGATPLDVILAFIIGSVLSRGINGTATLSGTAAATATLVGIHWVFTRLAWHFHGLGNLMKGRPRSLIIDGQIDWANMRKSHISEQDLREALRLNANVDDPAEVKFAVKERSGEIGVVKNQTVQVMDVDVQDGVKTIRIVVSR